MVAKGLPKGRFARRRELRMADQAVEGELMALCDAGATADLCVLVQTPEEAKGIALKGILRFVGLEVPRVHDAGAFLK